MNTKPERRLEALSAAHRLLASSIEFSSILGDLLNEVVEITQADRGFIMLANGTTDEAQFPALHNIEIDLLNGSGFQATRKWVDSVANSAERAIFTQAQAQASFSDSDTNAHGEMCSALCVPLRMQEDTIGILYADSVTESDHFSQEDLDIASALASQASILIQNRQLHDEIHEANLARTNFISLVTHELRVPLTSIKGYTDLLRHGVVGPVNDQQLNFLDIVRNNVDRMSALLTNLSDISRMESGRLRLDRQAVSIQSKIKEIKAVFQPDIEAKNQTLDVELAESIPDAYADPERVLQVLRLLVHNAHIYTPEYGKIQLRAEEQDQGILVQVSDDGIGISREDQENVFSQFFRSEDQAVREQQGWGLGLSVASKLIEMMNGRMGLESEYGKGSMFWFTLPKFDELGSR